MGEKEERLTLIWFASVNFPSEGRRDVVLDCIEASEGRDEEHPVWKDTALAVGEIWREGREGVSSREREKEGRSEEERWLRNARAYERGGKTFLREREGEKEVCKKEKLRKKC